MQIYKALIALALMAVVPVFGESRWGADYFPNVPLITHEGETVHFFDDLIKDKVVAINFIYTTCPDSCPLETARMAEVQRILGDRVGKDIFMYSITIEPERDTPEVLAAYAKRYKAQPGWLFLTGDEDDIVLLRKKLGLYLAEIQNDSNNHNLSLIIGNQATGRWMKRSPFENPYVLATQIGSWLTGWKAPSEKKLDYAEAPEVRQISQGEYLFRTRCVTCHTIGEGEEVAAPELVGPDLLDVHKRREPEWLQRWIAEPDIMLDEGDPLALGLYARYNEVPMPNMRMSSLDVRDVLRYISSESRRIQMERARERMRDRRARKETPTSSIRHAVDVRRSGPGELSDSPYYEASASGDSAAAMEHMEHMEHAEPMEHHGGPAHHGMASGSSASGGDLVAIMNAWVREAHPDAPTNAGYMTLINVGAEDLTIQKLESPAFDKIEFHEMAMVDGLMRMRELSEVVVPAGGQTRFEPGGKHLMLFGPQEHLKAGQTVEVTLHFQSGGSQTLAVQVADR